MDGWSEGRDDGELWSGLGNSNGLRVGIDDTGFGLRVTRFYGLGRFERKSASCLRESPFYGKPKEMKMAYASLQSSYEIDLYSEMKI